MQSELEAIKNEYDAIRHNISQNNESKDEESELAMLRQEVDKYK